MRVPEEWQNALADVSFAAVDPLIAEPNVLPPRERIFAALAYCAPDRIKAVIVGQDPYPTAGNANGLAFSVSPGVKVPASLKNIYKALADDLGYAIPTSGDLTAWAKQGVLLLNTVLTVREGESGSHRKKGWEPITNAILQTVNAQRGPIVFLALGKPAQELATSVDTTRHHVLPLPHPSPLNGSAFVVAAREMKPFTRTNALLVAGGREPIDWQL